MTISRRNALKSLLVLGASPLVKKMPKTKERSLQFLGLGHGGTNMVLKLLNEKQPGIYTSIRAEERADLPSNVNKVGYKIPIDMREEVGYFTITNQHYFMSENEPQKFNNIISPHCTKVLFVGLGGYTGTSLALSISYLLNDSKEFFYIIASTPFNFEGSRRKKISLYATDLLKKYPGFISYQADEVRRRFGTLSLSEAWKKSDDLSVEKFKNNILLNDLKY